MRKRDSEEVRWKRIRHAGHAGIVACALAFLLVAAAPGALARPEPGADDDAATKTAIQEFDTAQSDAAAAAPGNRTSKALEDKLDAATRKQEETDANPNATARQKANAKAAREKAESDADLFNAGTVDPKGAQVYREKLKKRREARAKLNEEKRRWQQAKNAPRTAARALRLINSRLEMANVPPPSPRQIGLLPNDEADSVAVRSPSISDLQGVRDDLIQSNPGPSVHVPHASIRDNASALARGENARLLDWLSVERSRNDERALRDDRGHRTNVEREPSTRGSAPGRPEGLSPTHATPGQDSRATRKRLGGEDR